MPDLINTDFPPVTAIAATVKGVQIGIKVAGTIEDTVAALKAPDAYGHVWFKQTQPEADFCLNVRECLMIQVTEDRDFTSRIHRPDTRIPRA